MAYTTLLLGFYNLAMAETVFIEATQDNTLYESPAGLFSNGSGNHLFAGVTLEGLKRRAVIAFKDLDQVPEGATITSAKLHLHLSWEIRPRTFQIHAMFSTYSYKANRSTALTKKLG
jgi:hypothetical protein